MGAVAVVTGVRSLLTGLDEVVSVAARPALELDNNLRFLSAIWAALGLGLWTCVRFPLEERPRVRVLSALIFAGGVGRLVAFSVHGLPAVPYLAITASELLAPMLWLLIPSGPRASGRE
jgi:hypothetical protein